VARTGLTHRDWLGLVPELVQECVDRWELELGDPYIQGAAGYTVRVAIPDGTPAVLKLIYPHREAAHEAAALAAWDGDGAVRLLESSADGSAMLIERCEPGTLLATADAETALTVLVGLLPRLWKRVVEPFDSLADEVEHWLAEIPRDWERAGRPIERPLLDEVTQNLRALSGSQGELVLLHQDLHTDNVLAAEREPWLVIDPKPLLGEREFSVAPIVRDYVLGHSRRDALRRLDHLTSELGLDRERAIWWTIGQTTAWMFENTQLEKHIETIRWLREAA
jgi:streptomycin 6-kinase